MKNLQKKYFQFLNDNNKKSLLEEIKILLPADIADFIIYLNKTEAILHFIQIIDELTLAKVFKTLPQSIINKIFEHLSRDKIVNIIHHMDLDDVADILLEIDEDLKTEIISKLDKSFVKKLTPILVSDEESAEGIMNPDIFTLPSNIKVKEALEIIKKTQKQIFKYFLSCS